MIKFTASNKWYELAAKSETDILDISAGCSTLSTSQTSEREFSSFKEQDLPQLRRREGFSTLLRQLRLSKGLSVEALASKLDIDVQEIILLERQVGYKASPRSLVALADYYKIPTKIFLQIGGAIKNIDPDMEQEMIRYAAESESFEKLTSEEKKLLNRTVKIISQTR